MQGVRHLPRNVLGVTARTNSFTRQTRQLPCAGERAAELSKQSFVPFRDPISVKIRRFSTVPADHSSTTLDGAFQSPAGGFVAPKSNESPNTNTSEKGKRGGLKFRLLEASILQVPVYGWTADAIAAAAVTMSSGSIALAGMVNRHDLICHYMQQSNERLRQDLQQSSNFDGDDKVYHALRSRLSYNQDLIRAGRWHEGMALGARPENMLETNRLLKELIGIVEEYGSNHQPWTELQRLSLGAVYVATELHMLSHSGSSSLTSFDDSWEFLRARLGEWKNGSLPLPYLPDASVVKVAKDAAFVASSVASAAVSGFASLMLPLPYHEHSNKNKSSSSSPNGSPFSQFHSMQLSAVSPSEFIWNAVVWMQSQQQRQTAAVSNPNTPDGTNPKDYEPKRP